MVSGVLNTNQMDSTSSVLFLTTEKTLTLYINGRTGVDNNHRVGIELSPDDGVTWFAWPQTLVGIGILTISHCVATQARAIVVEAEGASSSIIYYLLAR